MANPAELLYRELTSWRSSYVNAFAPPESQRIAVRHLDAIDELLGQMDMAGKRTDIFRRHFGRWEKLTLHHPHGWETISHQKPHDDNALEHLDHLGDRLAELIPKLNDDGLDEIRAYVDAAAALLDEDDSLSEDLKLHARQVIAHLRWCVDNYEAVGDFSLSEAIDRLVATILKTAMHSRDRDRWQQWLNTVVYPFAVNVASAIPAQVLIQLTLGAGG